tara:strand:- start:2935 stop:3174 length:240 start_codon:yes stop_codon:yes gene_type:complete
MGNIPLPMISSDLVKVVTVLASTHRRYPETLPEVLPLFASVLKMTHRELLVHLWEEEADWPWHEPPQQKQRTGLNSSPE